MAEYLPEHLVRTGGSVPVSLDQVVPWGRSLDEYIRMFDLSEGDLSSAILDCGAGPASFNAEMRHRGCTVVSCDPIFRFSAAHISRRIDDTYYLILEKAVDNRDKFLWHEMKSPEQLGIIRMAAMKQFLEHFPLGISEGRYRVAELPSLPFRDFEFDLALCSHLLFTYSHMLSIEFHLAAVRELCRVAREARVFPLMPNFGENRSEHVAPLIEQLTAEGYRCAIRTVPYEFQKGGNEMLLVRRVD